MQNLCLCGVGAKGDGHILFLSCTEAGHKEFSYMFQAEHNGAHTFFSIFHHSSPKMCYFYKLLHHVAAQSHCQFQNLRVMKKINQLQVIGQRGDYSL
jgi:hypothetical protein